MNILLDTNAFIWFSEDDEKLSEKGRIIIEEENNIIFVSVVTFWEIAIKKSIRKLEMTLSINELYKKAIDNGFEILPILFEHVQKIETLPYYHKDPFDRIIIAQSIVEDMTVVTSDDVFVKYNVKRIW